MADSQPRYDSRPATYEHIHVVQRHLHVAIKILLNRSLLHDRSKLRSPEREVFDEQTPKLWGTTYGTPEYEEAKAGLSVALEHHYNANRHHPEFHRDGIHGMSLIDLLEMICDWLAATARHEDGDIRRSIELNQERFGYGDDIKRLLHNTVDALDTHI